MQRQGGEENRIKTNKETNNYKSGGIKRWTEKTHNTSSSISSLHVRERWGEIYSAFLQPTYSTVRATVVIILSIWDAIRIHLEYHHQNNNTVTLSWLSILHAHPIFFLSTLHYYYYYPRLHYPLKIPSTSSLAFPFNESTMKSYSAHALKYIYI